MENEYKKPETEKPPLMCVICGINKEDFPQKMIHLDGFCDDCSELANFDSLENVFTVMRNLRSP